MRFYQLTQITTDMSLHELLFGNDESEEIDHYRVSHQRNGNGWQPLDEFDELEEPISKQTFEYNARPLDPGQYKLFAVKDNLHTKMPDGIGWKLTVEDDTTDDLQPAEERIQELEEKIEQLNSDQDQTDDIEQILKKRKAEAVLEVLEDPTFIEEHGDEIALSMLDDDSNT